MNIHYKKIRYTVKRWTGMAAVVASTFFFACGESNHQGGGADGHADANEGTRMGVGNENDMADTLTVGGASDGTPPGYGAMRDTVQTPGLNLDSIRERQTGSNAVNSGTNSGAVNSSANSNGSDRTSALGDSVIKGTKSNTGEQLDSSSPLNKNVNPSNKTSSGSNIE